MPKAPTSSYGFRWCVERPANVLVSNAESQAGRSPKVPRKPLREAPPPEASNNFRRALTGATQVAFTKDVRRSAWCPAHPRHSTAATALPPTDKTPSTAPWEEDTDLFAALLVPDTAQSEWTPAIARWGYHIFDVIFAVRLN